MLETKNANWPGVAEEVVAILRCLSCQGRLNSGGKGLVAAKNLGARPATFFEADAFKLPFTPQSFDYIYGIGVLHHTADCAQAFKGLARPVKPGGCIAIDGEVFRGFESCGLEDPRVIGEPIAVQGARPWTAVTDSIPQATEVAQCAE